MMMLRYYEKSYFIGIDVQLGDSLYTWQNISMSNFKFKVFCKHSEY